MVTVALAGATTGLGYTLLQTFLTLNPPTNPTHHLIILSRTPQPHLSALGLEVRVTDYQSHSQLVSILSGVHTLLSTLGGANAALLDAQLALIAAAREAGVRRFAPSEYAGIGYEGVDLYAGKAKVWEATRASGLEYTRFACGLFMSVFAAGTPKGLTEVGLREGRKSGEEEALAGLRRWNFVVNVSAGTADLAGDGSAEVVFTEMRDIGRFVWAALSLEKWPETLGMRGSVMSYVEVVKLLEKVQGRKLLVRENDLDELLEAGNKDPALKFYNQARVATQKGGLTVGDELNRLFPGIKPVTLEEYLEKWWGGVELGDAAWSSDRTFSERDFSKR